MLPQIPPVVDSFTGANQNPLARTNWTNKIITTDATCQIASNALKGTGAGNNSAWWSSQTLGPDCIAFATIASAFAANDTVQVWARMTSPGAAGVTGYFTQLQLLAGTDQWKLFRRDSGANAPSLLTVNQEVTAGDKIGIRCVGSTIEMWWYNHTGATWTLLGSAVDTTYAAAGYTGLRMLGTTGTLDDFSAGTIGGISAALVIESDLSSASPRSSSPVYTDITSAAFAASTRRGRAYELAEVDTGQAGISLENHDRAFDPLNTAGAYYPNLVPMRKTRISVTLLGATYRAFTGYITNFPPVWQMPRWSEVKVPIVDGFGPLSLEANVVGTWAQEDTGTRIGHVLDAIGFPAGDRVIDTGISQVAAATFAATDKQGALDHIRAVELTENGIFYFDGQGRAVFKNRQTLYNQVSKATFSDAGDLDFEDALGDYSDQLVYNAITVTDSAGNAVTVTDATSQAAYWPRSLQRDTLLPAGSTEVTSAAQWLLAQYKQPGFRFESISFIASLADGALYEALTRDIGDRITVTFTPPGGGSAITKDCFVQSIAHAIVPGDPWVWTTTYQLAPAGSVGVWVLDTGALDTTTTLSY